MKFTVVLKKDEEDSLIVSWLNNHDEEDKKYYKITDDWAEQGYTTMDSYLFLELINDLGLDKIFDEVSVYAGDSSVGRQLHKNDIISLYHLEDDKKEDDEDIYLHESKKMNEATANSVPFSDLQTALEYAKNTTQEIGCRNVKVIISKHFEELVFTGYGAQRAARQFAHDVDGAYIAGWSRVDGGGEKWRVGFEQLNSSSKTFSESKENKNINSLFERVLNEIWDNGPYHPREPKYAVKPSEREIWLNSKFDPKFVVEFNGQIVRVMPISKDILLIRDGDASADSFVYNIETELFLDRIRHQASHAINENIFGARSNFYLNVYTSDHNPLAQWDMRWDDSGTTLSVYSDTGVKESFSSTDEDIDEALDLCAGKWEETLSELFEDAIPETLDDTLRKEFLKESRRSSRKNKLKESELPDDLVKMSKDDGSFVGQNVEGMVEDGCEDPVDMILENEVDSYLYDSYVSNKYPEYEKDYKRAVYAAAYDYLVDKGLI